MKRFATCWLLAILLTTIAWADATDAGVAMLRDGRFAEAETALSAVLQQPDAPLTASYWRGRARLALERWAAAAEDFRAVLDRLRRGMVSRPR